MRCSRECARHPSVLRLEMNVTKSKKVGDNVDMKEIGWYCTQEQESVPEAIEGCPCRIWMTVELVLEAAMAPKVDVSSMDV